jgi:UDP-3-O-[3-hydroxymyristoyl] glucosamine N-acyltransferase
VAVDANVAVVTKPGAADATGDAADVDTGVRTGDGEATGNDAGVEDDVTIGNDVNVGNHVNVGDKETGAPGRTRWARRPDADRGVLADLKRPAPKEYIPAG